MRLKEKVVVVTGGASGIGRAAAICCAREGARIGIADLDRAGVEATVCKIKKEGGTVFGRRVDVQERQEVQTFFQKVEVEFGRVDGLVLSAGILEGALVPIDLFEEETWDRVININVKGCFLAAKFAVPVLERSGGGVMVLISSGAGVTAGSSSVAYGSSKGGVHGLSLVLAAQLADRNIRVHAVCPGSLETPLKMRVVKKQAQRTGLPLEEMKKALGDPEGVGKVLAFLISDEADYVRGSIFTR